MREDYDMTQQTSVVTPERFASGMTYGEYMSRITRNRDQFQANYDGTPLTEEDVRRFKEIMARPNGPAKVLALAEDWCPDVFRGLPVMARIAEATGMELRVFPRDENLDIMNEFLKDGQFQSIPTFVFYTKDHRYICHWIERPQKANDEMHLLPQLYEGRTREEAAPDVQKFREGPVWASWRRATIDELLQLLDEKTK
jgi:thiol-disulfide isomerase/thioredoxin